MFYSGLKLAASRLRCWEWLRRAPHHRQEGALRYSEAQIVAHWKGILLIIYIYFNSFLRGYTLYMLDFVCNAETRTHDVFQCFSSATRNSRKSTNNGHEINIPKMTRAAKWHLKSLSSHHRRRSTPPPPRVQRWNVIPGKTPKYSWHIKSNSAWSKNPYVNSHTLEKLQTLSVWNTHTLQFDQSQSETLLTICFNLATAFFATYFTIEALAGQQQADVRQTQGRRSAKSRDTGDTPEVIPVIPSLKTRPVRGHQEAHPNTTSYELLGTQKTMTSSLRIQNLGAFQGFKRT